MKKLKTILFSLGILFIAASLTGCNNTANNENGGSNYKGELTIAGVGPEISFEPTVEEGTLVLRGYFEDHTDHIFFKAGKWENFFESENKYLPGTKVKFKGYVLPLDAAAGNHYYDVVNVESIKVISFLDTTGVKEILETYNYCESDDDCTYTMGECPFGCFIPYNKKFGEIPSKIMDNYFEINGKSCDYDCLYMDKVVCENYKCTMTTANDEVDDVQYCTEAQKSADFCTMIYAPVCGNDGKTYGNDCVACQSETVESYTQGECDTQLIDGDKNSLLDKIYKTAALIKDIRELGEDYDMQQAISDDVIILTDNNKVTEHFNYTIPLRRDKKFKSLFVRFAQNTIEGDLVIYDIFYDTTSDKIYFITDFTRDRFSAPEDRVINIRQFENIGIYEHNGIKYGVLYNGEINDEVFQSEDCFVLANLED